MFCKNIKQYIFKRSNNQELSINVPKQWLRLPNCPILWRKRIFDSKKGPWQWEKNRFLKPKSGEKR